MCAHLNDSVGDSIIVALAFDSGYTMSAAVTLRSVAENVQGPVTAYILDVGLRTEDKQKIEESIPNRSLDITLLYIDLPPNSLALNVGPSWAKIDMMKCVPAERVIYLDADTLVRKDLRELWNTDLNGHSIAAAPDIVPDIWRPMGDQHVPQGPYFNSGVLLLDLVKIRPTLPKLEALCYEIRDPPCGDRDPLNIHFGGDWALLSLTWNAQGTGSMVKWPDPVGQKLPLDQLDDPAIIHFSGPLHPSMVNVLAPYLQPFVAKPWGYAGAPGHPHAKDWWDMLEKTVWKGWRETREYKEMCDQTRMKMLKSGLEAFNKRLEGMKGIDY